MGYYPGPQRFIGTVTNVTRAVLSAVCMDTACPSIRFNSPYGVRPEV